MSDASAVVAAAAQAVEDSDTGTPPSAEVRAQERIAKHENAKGPKAAAAKGGAKPARPAAKKSSKYDDATKAASKRAGEIRGRANAVAPITVTRVVAALKAAKTTPEEVVKSFASIKRATEYAGGDKSIEAPAIVGTINDRLEDPFAKSRGLVSIALALAGK